MYSVREQSTNINMVHYTYFLNSVIKYNYRFLAAILMSSGWVGKVVPESSNSVKLWHSHRKNMNIVS